MASIHSDDPDLALIQTYPVRLAHLADPVPTPAAATRRTAPQRQRPVSPSWMPVGSTGTGAMTLPSAQLIRPGVAASAASIDVRSDDQADAQVSAALAGTAAMRGPALLRPGTLLAGAVSTLATPVGAMGSPVTEPGDAAAISSTAVHQPLSHQNPPAPLAVPLGAGLALLASAIALVAVAIWNERGRPWPRRRAAPSDALLPRSRWGATAHERLHDPRYLGLILDAELNGSQQTGERNQATPRQPAGGETDAAER